MILYYGKTISPLSRLPHHGFRRRQILGKPVVRVAEADESALEVDELVGVLGKEVASGEFVIGGRYNVVASRSSRWNRPNFRFSE